MDKTCFTPEQPTGYWNAEQLADEIKYSFHQCKIYGDVTLTFDKLFCKIKEITLNVRKEKTDKGFKTIVTVKHVLYEQENEKRFRRSPLKLIKPSKDCMTI